MSFFFFFVLVRAFRKIWDAMEALNNLIDSSDPDLELPNIQHLFQSAEAMRLEGRLVLIGVLCVLFDFHLFFLVKARLDASYGSFARLGEESVPLGK